jgi:AraC-like DNA-binding protein
MDILAIFRLFYLLGAVNALFFSVLIFSKKTRTVADKILGAWLIILSAQLIIPFLYLTNLGLYYRYAGIEIAFFVFHPVFLNFYVKSMIGQSPTLKNIRFAIIYILVAEVIGLSFFLYPPEARYEFIKGTTLLPRVYYPFFVFIMIFFFYYCYDSYKVLKNYRISVVHVYSYRENVDLFWLRRLIILFTLIVIIVFPIELISYFNFHSVVFADYFFYLTLVVFIFFLGYWGYQQGEIFNFQSINQLPKEKNSDKATQIPPEIQKQYKQKALQLKQIMLESKPFLDPKLAIHDLAGSIDVPPHQLSKIINKEFHSSFFEFVNSYRVEEFKQKSSSSEYKNITILGIAYECGFNSKSAFNRIFKESTGLTPGEYLKHHQS